MAETIYLDNNASTPLAPEVADAMREAAARFPANPASQHRPGQLARQALEDSRERIAAILGAQITGRTPDRLIFTSGGTEANNLAIFGLLARSGPTHLVTSAIEHPSILAAAIEVERRGWQVTRVGATRDGVIDLGQLAEAIRDHTQLVSIMAANNETGVIQPIREISELCAARSIPFHTDGAQWIGKLAIQFHDWNFAAMSCVAHKFHGPLGIGALLVRHDVVIAPQLFGGHQQGAERPGTESIALAVGMATALESWQRESKEREAWITSLRDDFEARIIGEIPSSLVVGRASPRLPNTSNIAFVGIDRQALFLALDMAGVACSTGSACASGSSEPSPVLLAMGLEKEVVESALRFSFGAQTTVAESTEACRRIINAVKHLRQ